MTVAALTAAVLAGSHGPSPAELNVTSAFWLHNTTRLPGADVTYRNYYVLLRVGEVFGACSFEAGEVDPDYCAGASGLPLSDLLAKGPFPSASQLWMPIWPPLSHTICQPRPKKSSSPPVLRTSAREPVTPQWPACWTYPRVRRSR